MLAASEITTTHKGTIVAKTRTIDLRTVIDALDVVQTLPAGNDGVTITSGNGTISFSAQDRMGTTCFVVAPTFGHAQDTTPAFTAHVAEKDLSGMSIPRRAIRRTLTFHDGMLRCSDLLTLPATASTPVTTRVDQPNAHASVHVDPASFAQALAAVEPSKRAVQPRNEGHTRLTLTRHGQVKVSVVGDYSAATTRIKTVGTITPTADCHAHTRIEVWLQALRLLNQSAERWTVTLIAGETSDQVTITDGATAITVVTPTAKIPNFDAHFTPPKGVRYWDLEITDIAPIVDFLSTLPRSFSDDYAFVQIRNHSDEDGRTHPIDMVARLGSQLIAAGQSYRGTQLASVTTTSIDEAEVDVTLSQLRQLIATATRLGARRVTLRGYTPYESMAQLFLICNDTIAVTIGRVPQPL